MSELIRIGVIGGSGLYKMDELTDTEEVYVSTPFGDPSGPVVKGTVRGKRVAFLPRHGIGHVYNPSEVNYRANIFALKSLGVRFIISVSACGSLREDYAPGHIVVPDQLVDFTKGYRNKSFFENGIVAHVGTADPFCPELSGILYKAVESTEASVHRGGAFVTIEGPRFSTRGESELFRSWGLSIIGMTTSPEAFLAREAEMSYAVMAHITDYDVWHDEPVSTEMVMKTFSKNLKNAHASVVKGIELIDENADYEAHHALAAAVMTDRSRIDRYTADRLDPLVGKYLK
ncbi:MAG: S-methyl-5'-thioadenosine phosphorylase [bacterium]